MIQYVGTPACPIPAPHGNSASDRAYVRTNPSVLAKIKEVVAASGDQAGAAKLYKEAVRSSKYCDERACPRNIKQVYVTVVIFTMSGMFWQYYYTLIMFIRDVCVQGRVAS